MKKIILADAVRGFAASYVFACHLVISSFPETARWTVLFRFGQEGVMLFFLLSGFVIMYSMETGSDKSFGTYLPYLPNLSFGVGAELRAGGGLVH